jgi:hypothetical protein
MQMSLNCLQSFMAYPDMRVENNSQISEGEAALCQLVSGR